MGSLTSQTGGKGMTDELVKMVYWHPDCKYCEIVYEFGNEYQCCKHPKKQDSEDEMWAECEQHCELIETK